MLEAPLSREPDLAQVRSDLDAWSSGAPTGYAQSAADDVTYFHNVPAHARSDGIQPFRECLSALREPIARLGRSERRGIDR
jgi:hypothetical protein